MIPSKQVKLHVEIMYGFYTLYTHYVLVHGTNDFLLRPELCMHTHILIKMPKKKMKTLKSANTQLLYFKISGVPI